MCPRNLQTDNQKASGKKQLPVSRQGLITPFSGQNGQCPAASLETKRIAAPEACRRQSDPEHVNGQRLGRVQQGTPQTTRYHCALSGTLHPKNRHQ